MSQEAKPVAVANPNANRVNPAASVPPAAIQAAMQKMAQQSAAPATPSGALVPAKMGIGGLIKGLFSELSPASVKKAMARGDDLDYMSETAAASLQGPPKSTHIVLWGAVLFLIAFFVWAAYANIGEATVGEGKVIPAGQVQVVQNLEGGIVKEINVKVGDSVKRDDTLLVIDSTRYVASDQETAAKDSSLRAKIARLSAEVNGTSFLASTELIRQNPEQVRREQELYRTRQSEFTANTSALRQQIDQRTQEIVEKRGRVKQITASLVFLDETVAKMRPVVKAGAMSEIEMLAKEREQNDLRGELDSARVTIPRLESAVSEARNKLQSYEAKFRADALAELNQARGEQQGTEASKVATEDRVARAVVKSPVNGTIKSVKVTTVGGVIQPGNDIIEIVPSEESLLVEAKVRPKDIAFLHPGQDALVKYSAYDSSIYGSFAGKLEYISADSVLDEQKKDSYYMVRIRTSPIAPAAGNRPVVIIPGMTATVHIQTGAKTFLQYLLKPVIKTKDLAFRER